MKKLLSILFLLISFIASAQTYDPTKATVSNKPYGMAQAFPTDARSFFYDATNFLWRPYQSTTEVKTYLNLAKYRAGNFLIIVDSGGTLNSNGTYTGGVNNFWMFKDGVLDANLVELNLQGGASGCPTCFFTTTQLDTVTFTLNRPNGTKDTVQILLNNGVYITTANNFLTLTGTNVQAGGPLVQDTYANGGGHVFGITGNIFEQGQGATLTAANVMTTGSDGNSFPVIGSTQINAITTTNRQPGTIISFTFTGTPLLRNNQVAPAGSAPLLLAGGVDYTAATNDVIFFLYDGVANVWHETSRKLAGAVIPVTANNGITLTGSLLQISGSLIKPTTIAGNNFPFFFNGGRVEMPMGLPILAAGDLVIGNDGNYFHVTGTTQINAITTTNFQAGAQIGLVFDGIVTVKNNTVGGVNTAPMLLAGRVDYTSAVGDYMGFFYDGVNWYEKERKLAGSVTSITLNNGLTLTGTLGQLGGPLVQNTTITGGAFTTTFTSTLTGGSATVNINNTSTGIGLIVNGANNDGIHGTGNNGSNGVSGFTDFGDAIYAQTGVGGIPFASITTPQTTSSVDAAFIYNRSQSGGVSANGEGLSGVWTLPSSTAATIVAVKQVVSATDVTNATFTAKYALNGYAAGSSTAWFDITGNTANFYGTGTAISATAGTIGAFLFGSTVGVVVESPTIPNQAINTSTSTNTVVATYLSSRQGSSYIGAIGNGTKITFDAKDNAGSINGSGDITNKLVNVSPSAVSSQFDFNTIVAGATTLKLSIGPNATFLGSTRFETTLGNGVASTGNLTLGTDGNVFHITGTTTINAITTANWQAGSVFRLIFDGSLTVKNNTAGGAGTAVMHLAGAADYSAAPNGVLTLVWDGTSFFEVSRSVN